MFHFYTSWKRQKTFGYSILPLSKRNKIARHEEEYAIAFSPTFHSCIFHGTITWLSKGLRKQNLQDLLKISSHLNSGSHVI